MIDTQVETQLEDTQIDNTEMTMELDPIQSHLDVDEEDGDDCLLNDLDELKSSETQLCKKSKISSGSGPDLESLIGQLALQTTMSITNLNKQTDQFNSIIVQLGQRLNDNIITMGQKIDSAVKEVDDKFERKFEQLREENKESRKKEMSDIQQINVGNSRFTSDIGRVIWPVMPILFDTLKGLYSWFPVKFTDTNHESHDVVVLSVPMTIYLLQTFDGKVNDSRSKRDVENHLRNLDRFQLVASERIENFTRIMKQTPFKSYALYAGKSGKNRPISFKNNVDNYIIMEKSYWKDIMNSVAEAFPDRKLVVPDSTKSLHRNVMAQQFALTAASISDSRSAPIKPFGGIQVSFEDRKTWPSMGFPIWRECYSVAVKEFFGIDESLSRHIVNGVYDPSTEECVSFEEAFESVAECDKYDEEVEPEEETSRKRSREDWTQDY